VGRLIETLQSRGPLRIGVIGLGAGTLAAYGRSGDTVEFFEINPAIIDIALSKFSYVIDSAASTKVHLGDGRVRLQTYDGQPFDILVIDAFSGDSIPTHLLSTEALTLYLRHLTPDGVVIFHISNLYLDLGPVVSSIARATRAYAALLLPTSDSQGLSGPSEYALVTADAATLRTLETAGIVGPLSYCASLPAWTDNYADVWSVRKDAVRRCALPKPLAHGAFE
jgi:spermidine synthase